jgi:hypothetical protein
MGDAVLTARADCEGLALVLFDAQDAMVHGQ